jgi:curved DNA-binding protein CbpA
MTIDEACLLLGVTPAADLTEIRRNYIRLAKIWHPDMHTKENEKERAAKVFIEIEEAYHLLKDTNLDNAGSIYRGRENIVETVIEMQLNIFMDKLLSKLLNLKAKHVYYGFIGFLYLFVLLMFLAHWLAGVAFFMLVTTMLLILKVIKKMFDI